ncbi:MAG: hypothetical protein WDM77_18325 [Steroidobacteraceae bacterium]
MLIRTMRVFLAPYRGFLALVLLLSLAGTMASLYLPTLNAALIDQGLAKGNIGFIGARVLDVGGERSTRAMRDNFGLFRCKAAMSFGRDLRGAIFGQVLAFSGRDSTISARHR